ncbi:MAG TPA: glycosyltransferase family 2 protein, partial [Gemmataceae bacterium]|nr:glycosyltransferase family 2 protein [Gemmataceae bacterium]
ICPPLPSDLCLRRGSRPVTLRAPAVEGAVAMRSILDDNIEVSVVMPCLDEARTVGRCVEKAVTALQKMGLRGEVIVADNGSSDGSPEIAEKHGAWVVHVEGRGYGSALQAGIAAARGRYVIMGDADDSYDFSDLYPFVERLRAGDELVMGNRFRGGIKPGAMPWHHRYVGNPILTAILNLFFRSPIHDAHCGLRGFRKEAYERLGLQAPGMEFASEMVVRACLSKQKISEVPVVLHPDGRDRPPHLRSFRDGWRHLRFLLLMCPRWLYLVPAVVLSVFGLGLMAWLTPGPRTLGGVVFDVHSLLLGSLCTTLGSQVFWTWLHAQAYGWKSGLLPADGIASRLFQHFRLERWLLIGLAFLACGLGLTGWVLCNWYRHRVGPLDLHVTLRWVPWGLTLTILGAQTIFGSFYLGMIELSGRTRDWASIRTLAPASVERPPALPEEVRV